MAAVTLHEGHITQAQTDPQRHDKGELVTLDLLILHHCMTLCHFIFFFSGHSLLPCDMQLLTQQLTTAAILAVKHFIALHTDRNV